MKLMKKEEEERSGEDDHSGLEYLPFRKYFYFEVPELTKMSDDEVDECRTEMEGIKVKGKNVPKPIKNWPQCGVSSKILHVRHDRDCKDWVGEDTPFFLSLFRHTADQEPLGEGDGPITIMMTPNRGSFAYRSGRKFVKVIDAQFVCTDRHLREDHRAEEGGLGHRLHADGDVLRHLPQADGGPDQEDLAEAGGY
jgi:ATP-dependent RNA helicase DDX46/PRP5